MKPPGQRLNVKDFDRLGIDFRARVAVLNGVIRRGIPGTNAAAPFCPGNRSLQPSSPFNN